MYSVVFVVSVLQSLSFFMHREAAAAESGDSKGNPHVGQETSSSSVTSVQQTNCHCPTENLELEEPNAPAIVVTSASTLRNSSFDSAPAPELGMGPKDSSQGFQHDSSPRSSTASQPLEGEGPSPSTSTLSCTLAQTHGVTRGEETLAPAPLQDRSSTDGTVVAHAPVQKPTEDATGALQAHASAPLEGTSEEEQVRTHTRTHMHTHTSVVNGSIPIVPNLKGDKNEPVLVA